MSVRNFIDLKGKRGLIIGIANKDSIAYGCASVLHNASAEIVVTYLNDKAKSFVQPLADELNAAACLPCDVTKSEELEEVFNWISTNWGNLDYVIHSIAFSRLEDLHTSVENCSREGFHVALDITCYSFLQIVRLASRLMKNGGTIITMTYAAGSQRAAKNYGIMGIAKAALESAVRYTACTMAKDNIKIHAISPGPVKTRAASGILDFNLLLNNAMGQSPMKRLVRQDEIGQLAAFLISDACSGMTGQVIFVDTGNNLI